MYLGTYLFIGESIIRILFLVRCTLLVQTEIVIYSFHVIMACDDKNFISLRCSFTCIYSMCPEKSKQ